MQLTHSDPTRAPWRLRAPEEEAWDMQQPGAGAWLGEQTRLVSSPQGASASAFQSETLSQAVVPAMCQAGCQVLETAQCARRQEFFLVGVTARWETDIKQIMQAPHPTVARTLNIGNKGTQPGMMFSVSSVSCASLRKPEGHPPLPSTSHPIKRAPEQSFLLTLWAVLPTLHQPPPKW